MKRLIKSIKKNPDAGRQDYCVPGSILFYATYVDGSKIPLSDESLNKILAYIKKHKKYPSNIKELSQERDAQHMRTMFPEPNYFITYKSLKVQCKKCKARFEYDKLTWRDLGYDEDGFEITDYQVCPKCREPNCLSEQVVNETVNEFKARTNYAD